MIIYKNLGRNGRLGNQLFQIAATLAHAEKMGVKALFNHWEYNKYMADACNGSAFIDDTADGNPSDYTFMGKQHTDYLETGFHYEPIPNKRNLILNGYFQSEKYFKKQESQLRGRFRWSLLRNYQPYHGGTEIAIHVRRGDYLTKEQYHPVVPERYYEAAIKDFISNYYGDHARNEIKFIIYSDDIDYCRSMDVFKPGNVIPEARSIFFYSEETHGKAGIPFDLHTMASMARCRSHIIANSSYSWWVAWLSGCNWVQPYQFIYAPSPWFGPACNHRTDDIYCDGWKIINY